MKKVYVSEGRMLDGKECLTVKVVGDAEKYEKWLQQHGFTINIIMANYIGNTEDVRYLMQELLKQYKKGGNMNSIVDRGKLKDGREYIAVMVVGQDADKYEKWLKQKGFNTESMPEAVLAEFIGDVEQVQQMERELVGYGFN